MIGDALCEMRKRSGLTLRELAEMAGISHTTLSRYENGHREPRLRAVQSIADALGITVEEIMSLAQSLEYAEGEGAEYVPAAPSTLSGDHLHGERFNLERWRVLVSLADIGWREKLLLGLLPAFMDRESGIVAITRDEAITQGYLSEETVDIGFSIILNSGFVERIGAVEYMLRLQVPPDNET